MQLCDRSVATLRQLCEAEIAIKTGSRLEREPNFDMQSTLRSQSWFLCRTSLLFAKNSVSLQRERNSAIAELARRGKLEKKYAPIWRPAAVANPPQIALTSAPTLEREPNFDMQTTLRSQSWVVIQLCELREELTAIILKRGSPDKF